MSKFEDLVAFQRALDLVVEIYRATEKFPRDELFGLTGQLRRAAISIVSNIAEGQGRLTKGEWRQMLSNARGSLFEVQAQLIVAHRLGYLADEEAARLNSHTAGVARPLAGLLKWLKKASNHQPATRN